MPRGSAPGERRGGRQKGSPNKVGADVRELARQYTQQAINTLAKIMTKGKSEQARAMASEKLLDRGWGKAAQAMEFTGKDGTKPIIVVEHRIVRPGSSE